MGEGRERVGDGRGQIEKGERESRGWERGDRESVRDGRGERE